MAVSVAILDDYQRVALSYGEWAKAAELEVTAFADHLEDIDALVDRLAGFEVIVAMRERTAIPRELLERLPNLRHLVTTGMANASIDMAAAKELGISISGTGLLPYTTAELTIGLMIALVRQIPAEDANVRAGGWQRTIGLSLAGLTLGVLGLGRLGKKVTTIAVAMDMRVIAWSTNLTPEAAADAGAEYVEKDELLRQADIATIHLRLSDRTKGLLGARELALLGPNSYLINTSRGPIVDEAALVDALQTGTIAGAALDVFDIEPLPEHHVLRSLSNTILTPHLGYVAGGTYEMCFIQARENIEAFLEGQALRVLNG